MSKIDVCDDMIGIVCDIMAKERITEEGDRVRRRCFPDDQIAATVQKIVELVTGVFLNENVKTVIEDTNDIVVA